MECLNCGACCIIGKKELCSEVLCIEPAGSGLNFKFCTCDILQKPPISGCSKLNKNSDLKKDAKFCIRGAKSFKIDTMSVGFKEEALELRERQEVIVDSLKGFLEKEAKKSKRVI